jgi:hypothetical protein
MATRLFGAQIVDITFDEETGRAAIEQTTAKKKLAYLTGRGLATAV